MSLSPDDEGLAAEYAVGTLDSDERAAAEQRRRNEPEFDGEISAWEARLAPLIETAPARAPPSDLYARIEARLAHAPVDFSVLRARLSRWRMIAGGASGVAAGLAAALAFAIVSWPSPHHQFVAVMQKSPDTPAFALTVDLDRCEFSVRPVAAEAPAGKSYELWLIAPDKQPKSLGVIDARAASGERRLGGDASAARDALYAVTLEREGGSANGVPTSAPVYFGKLVPVGP